MILNIIGIIAWAVGFVFFFQKHLIDEGCIHLLNPDENESGESGAKKLAILFLLLCSLWPAVIIVDIVIKISLVIRLAIIELVKKISH